MTQLRSSQGTARRRGAHTLFLERFLQSVSSDKLAGLFVLQLDKYNRIATSFGSARSDLCCAHYAELLRDFLPAKTPVIRLRDRKLAILMVRDSVADIVNMGRTLMEKVEPRMAIGPDRFSVDVNIGVAVYPTHADNGESLLRRGELALQRAKDSDSGFEVYEMDSSVRVKAIWKFESELKQAIEDAALEVHYQPQYAIAESRMCGAEALVRWRNKAGKLMPASEFIPAAERSGSIVPLTWVVFDIAARAADVWLTVPKPFSVSVNVPPTAIGHSEFFPRLRDLKDALQARGVELSVELTEDGLMQTDIASLENLNRIRDLGVGLAIDDFGKGYSSLNYLRQIPATELKIDGQFVSSMPVDERDRHIVKTAIELADAFEMQAVGEGVDNEDSLRLLADMKCNVAQGFFIARPMDGEVLAEWLRSASYTNIERALSPRRRASNS